MKFLKLFCNFFDIIYSAVVSFIRYLINCFIDLRFVSSILFVFGIFFMYRADGLYDMIPGSVFIAAACFCAYLVHKVDKK